MTVNKQEPVLVVKNLYKKFSLNKKQMKERKTSEPVLVAVNDLSFQLYKGEIYGLLGPNGAGKTTTLRMLATLISPTSGTITFLDKDYKKDNEFIRSKLGFLTSELKLDDFFTPDYTFDFFASLYSMDKQQIAKRKQLLFSQFGISEFAHTKISELSTGMKQKVSLAISLVHDPDLIIFDEPTNGLDIITSKIVEDYLLQLKSEGKTLIISTHIFSLVEKLCDRIGIIIDGKLVDEGEKANMCATQSLEEVFFNLYYSIKGGNE